MRPISNTLRLKLRRKDLRKNSTPAEELLWEYVRNKKTGYKFYRQYSIGPYIPDFYCPIAKLVVELDGYYHSLPEQKLHDHRRTEYLNLHGITVIRFSNHEVQMDVEAVVQKIKHMLPSF